MKSAAGRSLRNAVERTVPFGLITYSLITLWYTTKTKPSFEDMIIKLRRVIIAAQFQHPGPHQPLPEKTHSILLAWAAAET